MSDAVTCLCTLINQFYFFTAGVAAGVDDADAAVIFAALASDLPSTFASVPSSFFTCFVCACFTRGAITLVSALVSALVAAFASTLVSALASAFTSPFALATGAATAVVAVVAAVVTALK